ncbi:MAG TPA: hypothetical protein VG779_01125 [Actinomycetota bacterium]|nr:hypothetical protein [Actinomycetota bacterium]
MASGSLAVVGWPNGRLYAQIRAEPDPREAHAVWCATRADTAKEADLGGDGRWLIADLNFAAWACPLARPSSTVAVALRAGERHGER